MEILFFTVSQGSFMKQQRPEIIRDNKKRGEWAESVFAARAVKI